MNTIGCPGTQWDVQRRDDLTHQPAARTVEDACAHYGWTRTFVYQQLGMGVLKACKAGRRTLLFTEPCERLLADLPRPVYGASRKHAA